MRLVQFVEDDGKRWVGVVSEDGQELTLVRGTDSVYALARAAMASGRSLESLAAERCGDTRVKYDVVIRDCRILAPLDHPEPARCMISGTGLNHPGSAEARSKETDSDAMRLFQQGIEGGKPAAGEVGVQPVWYFKGNGTIVVPPERPLPRPGYAEGGGEEPELVALYVIDDQRVPCRLGFALGNEFSDQPMERRNERYLSHAKLRPCSFGPELLLGEAPQDIRGVSRIWRNNQVIWEKPFLTGEAHMSHSLANLEYHHFKYPVHRRPGDVHGHFLGSATLSFSDGVATQSGDVFEVDAADFGRPLRNPLVQSAGAVPAVRVL